MDGWLWDKFHLSDVRDAASEFDSHLHLGTGQLNIARIVREALPPDARVSIETAKDSPDSLDDFRRDVEYLAKCASADLI